MVFFFGTEVLRGLTEETTQGRYDHLDVLRFSSVSPLSLLRFSSQPLRYTRVFVSFREVSSLLFLLVFSMTCGDTWQGT